MAEWLKAIDSKSIVRLRVPGVRIPLSPYLFTSLAQFRLRSAIFARHGRAWASLSSKLARCAPRLWLGLRGFYFVRSNPASFGDFRTAGCADTPLFRRSWGQLLRSLDFGSSRLFSHSKLCYGLLPTEVCSLRAAPLWGSACGDFYFVRRISASFGGFRTASCAMASFPPKSALCALRPFGAPLAGTPMDVMNDRLIADAVKRGRSRHPQTPVHLVEPQRTEIEGGFPESFLWARGAKRYERIPPWCWEIRAESAPIGDGWRSSAVVVAFTEPAMELPGPLADVFGSLCWEDFARDFEP
jgi:hypothetical protein